VSLLSIKELKITIDFTDGAYIELDNPLQTTFDNIEINPSGNLGNIRSSCFFHSWNDDERAKFALDNGLWVISTPNLIAFSYGNGDKCSVPERFSQIAEADIDQSIFFAIPHELNGKRNHSITAILVCFN